METNFENAQIKIAELEKHLNVYESEKKVYMENKHREVIDMLIASRREEMGKYSEYLEYCLLDHYVEDAETVDKALKEIHYNFLLGKNPKAKTSFSAIETNIVDAPLPSGDTFAERYGDDIAKHLNNQFKEDK